jgi:hypothetical protein
MEVFFACEYTIFEPFWVLLVLQENCDDEKTLEDQEDFRQILWKD